jgi:hypothetical protein
MIFYVVMVIHRWEDIKLAGDLPVPNFQMKGSPIPGCVGWLAVFEDRAAAEEFADGLPIAAVEGEGKRDG